MTNAKVFGASMGDAGLVMAMAVAVAIVTDNQPDSGASGNSSAAPTTTTHTPAADGLISAVYADCGAFGQQVVMYLVTGLPMSFDPTYGNLRQDVFADTNPASQALLVRQYGDEVINDCDNAEASTSAASYHRSRRPKRQQRSHPKPPRPRQPQRQLLQLAR